VRQQASIQAGHSLLFGDQSEALYQAGIFRDSIFQRCLTESCSDDLENDVRGCQRANSGNSSYFVRISE